MRGDGLDRIPFYVIRDESWNTSLCWTSWSASIFDALARHPWRTRRRDRAYVLFVEGESRFEVNHPLFAGPRLGYVRYSPSLCDGFRVEPFLNSVVAPVLDRIVSGLVPPGVASKRAALADRLKVAAANRPDGGLAGVYPPHTAPSASRGAESARSLVVFPPIKVELAADVALQWRWPQLTTHATHGSSSAHVVRALTSGAEIGIYREGIDISFPPAAMHLLRDERRAELQDAAARAETCAPTQHFLALDATTIRSECAL